MNKQKVMRGGSYINIKRVLIGTFTNVSKTFKYGAVGLRILIKYNEKN